MEDSKVGNEKLLMARGNKESRKIYGWIQCLSKDEKQDWGTSREVDGKWGTGESVNALNSRFYYKIAIGSRKRYNLGSIW